MIIYFKLPLVHVPCNYLGQIAKLKTKYEWLECSKEDYVDDVPCVECAAHGSRRGLRGAAQWSPPILRAGLSYIIPCRKHFTHTNAPVVGVEIRPCLLCQFCFGWVNKQHCITPHTELCSLLLTSTSVALKMLQTCVLDNFDRIWEQNPIARQRRFQRHWPWCRPRPPWRRAP